MKYLVIGSGRMTTGVIFDMIYYGKATRIFCCDKSELSLKEMENRFKKNSVPIEYPDKKNNLTAMMRTTTFPAAMILEMLLDGRIAEQGVLRQEKTIPADLYIKELEKSDIRFDISEQKF